MDFLEVFGLTAWSVLWLAVAIVLIFLVFRRRKK